MCSEKTKGKTLKKKGKMMKKIIVEEKATLEELYKDSALTMVGLSPDDESLGQFRDWINEHTKMKTEDFYIIKGIVMNWAYQLTGLNAYPKDVTLVAVKLSDLDDPSRIILPRFEIGGKWFDDIVDNNSRRQKEIDSGR